MKKLLKRHGLFIIAIFIAITIALFVATAAMYWNVSLNVEPPEKITDFSYTNGNDNGTGTFPHTLKNVPPNSPVTVYADIEQGKYANLLVKTVYSKLKLYADDELIYECGYDGSSYKWSLDPPTLLRIVPLPETATKLRFEYVSPSQRSTLSLPVLMAGSDGALLSEVFRNNFPLFILSLLFIFFGMVAVAVSIFYRKRGAGFLNLGLFALAAGLWSFGENDVTAVILPYPALLYFFAFGGLFTMSIPLLKYGVFVLNPQKPKFLTVPANATLVIVIAAFILQLTGVIAFSKIMPLFHIIAPLNFSIFAFVTLIEQVKYKNLVAKQFILPSIVLAFAAVLEVVNYSLRFTQMLSLFFLSGALIFTLSLGFIGMNHAIKVQREIEEKASKADFYYKMAHDLLTPLTRVSTDVQVAEKMPEDAKGVLKETQAEIMAISKIINDALVEMRGE